MTWRDREAVEALDLPGHAKLVLGALAKRVNCHDPGRRAWPSVPTIAAEAGLSVSTVRRWLRRLESDGYLTVVGQRAGGRSPTVYSVTLDPGHSDRPPRSFCPPTPVTVTAESVSESVSESNASASGLAEPARDDVQSRALGPSRDLEDASMAETELTRIAQSIAAEWWESRHPRPVGKFLAARSRVREALEAGWTEPECARALRTFGYVPDRPAFVHKLESIAKIDRARSGEFDSPSVISPEVQAEYDANRDGMSGPWQERYEREVGE